MRITPLGCWPGNVADTLHCGRRSASSPLVAKILYATQWYDPEPNIIKGPEFVDALRRGGHTVDVLTGLPNYPTGRIYPGYRIRAFQEEAIAGAAVKRLPLYPSHNASSFGRSLNFISFFMSVLIYLAFRGYRYRTWYVYHPPITVGLAAAIVSLFVRRPFILEIQDLWPDSVVASHMAGTKRVVWVLSALCNFTYARAARIVVQSQGIADRLQSRGVPASKIRLIRNWADATAAQLPSPNREAHGMSNKFTLVYGGNLGRMQALKTALEAMAQLESEQVEAELVLIGDGIDRGALQSYANRLRLSNVRFVERVPQEQIGGWFAAADALLLHIAQDRLFTITIPSKTQYYLACGKPIIAGIEGEAAEMLIRSEAAVVVPPQDASALAGAIKKLASLPQADRAQMGVAGSAYYNEHLSFSRGIEATMKVIEEIL